MPENDVDLAETILGIPSSLSDDAKIELNVGSVRKALSELYTKRFRQAILFEQLTDALPDFVYFKDEQSRFIFVNKAHAKDLGIKDAAEAIGKSDFDFFKPSFAEAKFEDEKKIILSGKGWEPRIEHHFKSSGDERWVISTKHPWRDERGVVRGTFGLSRDITAQRKAEIALDEKHQLLTTLIDVLPCRIYVRDRQHRFRLMNSYYRDSIRLKRDIDPIGQRLDECFDDDRVNKILYEDEEVMRSGKPILQRIEFDKSPIESQRWLSVSKVPLKTSRNTMDGIVGVSFDITEQKAAEAKAKSVSKQLKAKNAQMESELAVARKIQRILATVRLTSILQESREFPLKAAYWYEPCEHLAGDFFHLVPVDKDRFGLFICDVMGHGVRSALVTVVLRGLLEEKRGDLSSPGKLFTRINEVIHTFAEDPDFPRFVTAVYALFDLKKRTIESSFAGHLPILRTHTKLKNRTDIPQHHAEDPALGIVEGHTYKSVKQSIPPHSTFLFGTDGLIEQISPEGFEFGWESLEECLFENRSSTPDILLKDLQERLETHTGKPSFDDDVCAIAISL